MNHKKVEQIKVFKSLSGFPSSGHDFLMTSLTLSNCVAATVNNYRKDREKCY